jgi:hypothetical protein
MSLDAFLITAALLGLLVLAAGAYGVLYGAARLNESARLIWAAYVAYGVLCSIAGAIVIATPLHFGWKILIGASAGVYYVIPPVTWHHLHRTHRDDGAQA